MSGYEFFLVSSLEKVFPTRRPQPLPENTRLSVWAGERASLQLVYTAQADAPRFGTRLPFDIVVGGGPAEPVVRSVELAPSELPSYAFAHGDDGYITHEPGLFPDLLQPLSNAVVEPLQGQYRSLWLSWEVPENTVPGFYPITVTARAYGEVRAGTGRVFGNPDAKEQVYTLSFVLRVGRARLPEQSLIHTEWFHADCLADYYRVSPLSEEHWRILERFIRAASVHGVNMLLTPVFTPPLDTEAGGERPTVQLVDIYIKDGAYSFDFAKLRRWTELCRRNGVKYLEIAHLFTQWGAEATPKVMAYEDGVCKRIFGWDVPAASGEYRRFLEALIPALREALDSEGYDAGHVYFHISDEPDISQLDSYRAARKQAEDLLEGCMVTDALSSLEFYKQGLVPRPIPAADHIQPFIDAGVPDLWVYYCCGQSLDVPNRFFSMPSARNRIMGVLMYLYDIKGFLQWGFNFYYSQYSRRLIDPFRVTDAEYAFPSGDAFLVYPGPDGEPLSSVRAEVQDEALLDLRAFQKLEELAGRELVERLIYEDAGLETITFKSYPRGATYLLELREKVAGEIEKRL